MERTREPYSSNPTHKLALPNEKPINLPSLLLIYKSDTITKASKRFIPAGNRRHYNPTFSKHIKNKIHDRNHLRSLPPTPDTLAQIQQLNNVTDNDIRQEQEAKWKHALEHFTFHTNPNRLTANIS